MTQLTSGSFDTPDETEFSIGDRVVYRSQGAGEIVAQVEREVGGKTLQYLQIQLMKGGMSLMVPLGQGDRVGLRRVTSVDRLPELLAAMRQEIDLPAGWTPRHRREQLLLSEGDVFRVAQLVGTLTRRDLEKPLSVTERRILDDARQMVATEVAMARRITLSDAQAEVEAALQD
ncbi:MAG TPA: CarD family transcriptional regulator [Deinococcales bacterium]|nr:CarD family transcriptional regulator [Deinococcales bacterium]